ncbi:MAG: response regulator receiver protein [Sulfurimonas sp.]|nr:MAG: response regulator receiver protein [Sulfurimonas sp.]
MNSNNTKINAGVKEYIKSLTLLCVEDNQSTQDLYYSIFKNCVKKLFFAYDGEDGYNKYLNNNIDIIITDYFMPNLNGIDMIERIREFDNDIPIILVSEIEDINVISRALALNINNFIKKPIIADEVLKSIENSSKLLLANKYIFEQKNKQLQALSKKDQYHSYQENLAFLKELNILKNDFYYQMIDMGCISLIDFLYKPLDVLSGDSYSVRKINNETTFYLIVDGMGKGISASMSSMLMTSFINHILDKMLQACNFNLHKLIEASLDYIKPILLDEESLSVDFITMDCIKQDMKYAKFAMPSFLVQSNNKVIKIKSNNIPISKYIQDFNISSYDTSHTSKFLFYSDGVLENSIKGSKKLYAEFIEEDFFTSFTKEDMKNKLFNTINKQEDDITFIFLNKLNLKNSLINQKKFDSNLDTLDIANDWYSNIWSNLCNDAKLIYSASIVFTELFMNAFEHGSLGLSAQDKHKLLNEDTYFDALAQRQNGCNKKINVTLHKINYHISTYIITQIMDEGEGFDTNILNKIFRNKESFNGRGVYVSKQSSEGIYYNSIGNTVLFLHKIKLK